MKQILTEFLRNISESNENEEEEENTTSPKSNTSSINVI